MAPNHSSFEARERKNWAKKKIIRIVSWKCVVRHFSHLKWLKVIIKWFTFNRLTKQWKMLCNTVSVSSYCTWRASFNALKDSHFFYPYHVEKKLTFLNGTLFFFAITHFMWLCSSTFMYLAKRSGSMKCLKNDGEQSEKLCRKRWIKWAIVLKMKQKSGRHLK